MKKIIAASLLVAASLALAGCGKEEAYPAAETKIETPDAAKSVQPVETSKTDENAVAPSDANVVIPKVQPPVARQAETYIVNMRTSGYSPTAMTVRIGDTVTFLNEEAGQHWPASLNSTKLDAGRALKMGESYSFKLITNGTLTVQDKIGKGRLVITTLK